jgi:hypothetical protein
MEAGNIQSMSREQFDLYELVSEDRGLTIRQKLKAQAEQDELAVTEPKSASAGNRNAYNDAKDAGAYVKDFAANTADEYARRPGEPHPRKGKGRSYSESSSSGETIIADCGHKPQTRGKAKAKPRSRSQGRTRGGRKDKGKGKARR